MRFRIYYADGMYSDTDGDIFDAPAWGVQFVTTIGPGGRWWGRYGEDYYWLDGDIIEGGDLGGLFDYLQRPGPRKVLFGRTIPDDQWSVLTERALHDPDYPQRG